MSRKGRLRSVLIGFAIVVVFVASVGWVSNANSRASCQQQVGSWLFNHPMGGRLFYLVDPGGEEEVRATFKAMGARFAVIGSKSANGWPRLSMRTHSLIPFVISVDYFWEREVEIGGGATKWFCCFFGWVVEFGETGNYSA